MFSSSGSCVSSQLDLSDNAPFAGPNLTKQGRECIQWRSQHLERITNNQKRSFKVSLLTCYHSLQACSLCKIDCLWNTNYSPDRLGNSCYDYHGNNLRPIYKLLLNLMSTMTAVTNVLLKKVGVRALRWKISCSFRVKLYNIFLIQALHKMYTLG